MLAWALVEEGAEVNQRSLREKGGRERESRVPESVRV